MLGLWKRFAGTEAREGADWDAPRLKAVLEGSGDHPWVLDVRTPAEFAAGHVPGARLVPLGRLGTAVDTLPREQTIVCVCASGHRSAVAAAMLRRAGLRAVSLRGGMMGWAGPVRR